MIVPTISGSEPAELLIPVETIIVHILLYILFVASIIYAVHIYNLKTIIIFKVFVAY